MAVKTIQKGSKRHQRLQAKAHKVRSYVEQTNDEGELYITRDQALAFAIRQGLPTDLAAKVVSHLFTKEGEYDPVDQTIPF